MEVYKPCGGILSYALITYRTFWSRTTTHPTSLIAIPIQWIPINSQAPHWRCTLSTVVHRAYYGFLRTWIHIQGTWIQFLLIRSHMVAMATTVCCPSGTNGLLPQQPWFQYHSAALWVSSTISYTTYSPDSADAADSVSELLSVAMESNVSSWQLGSTGHGANRTLLSVQPFREGFRFDFPTVPADGCAVFVPDQSLDRLRSAVRVMLSFCIAGGGTAFGAAGRKGWPEACTGLGAGAAGMPVGSSLRMGTSGFCFFRFQCLKAGPATDNGTVTYQLADNQSHHPPFNSFTILA